MKHASTWPQVQVMDHSASQSDSSLKKTRGPSTAQIVGGTEVLWCYVDELPPPG